MSIVGLNRSVLIYRNVSILVYRIYNRYIEIYWLVSISLKTYILQILIRKMMKLFFCLNLFVRARVDNNFWNIAIQSSLIFNPTVSGANPSHSLAHLKVPRDRPWPVCVFRSRNAPGKGQLNESRMEQRNSRLVTAHCNLQLHLSSYVLHIANIFRSYLPLQRPIHKFTPAKQPDSW